MQESALQLVLQSSLFVKVILFILLSFSVASWAIIVYKYDQFSAASSESGSFLSVFASERNFQNLQKKAGAFQVSPLVKLFQSFVPLRYHSKDEIDRSLRRQEVLEAEKLNAYLTFLAVTGSTAPFIGLLGTVWGIMNAFRGIGAAGSASLAVVAPGIAEALITTAAGLAAAIPAVMAYNAYLNWARKIVVQMEDFSEQLKDHLPKASP